MPTCFMLVGVPYSGKTTWAKDFVYPRKENTIILSTDEAIEELAPRMGMTYDEAFSLLYPIAEKIMYHRLETAINQGLNIVWDQTNLSEKARRAKLQKLSYRYNRVGIEFPIPTPKEFEERSAKRTDKKINLETYESMLSRFEHLRDNGPELWDKWGFASSFDRWQP